MTFNKKKLTDEQYRITQQHGTEPAYSGVYWDKKDPGVYNCICCDTPLFFSGTKYDSGSGWPSFYEPISDRVVGKSVDNSFFMQRTEVHCAKCNAHLGHVFPDGSSKYNHYSYQTLHRNYFYKKTHTSFCNV